MVVEFLKAFQAAKYERHCYINAHIQNNNYCVCDAHLIITEYVYHYNNIN